MYVQAEQPKRPHPSATPTNTNRSPLFSSLIFHTLPKHHAHTWPRRSTSPSHMTGPPPLLAQQLPKGSQNLLMSAIFWQRCNPFPKTKVANSKTLVEMIFEWTVEAVMMTTGSMVTLGRVWK